LRCGKEILVFDAGTGIRELGLSLMSEFKGGSSLRCFGATEGETLEI